MWLHQAEPDLWHVGLTRFALRMLGEPVDLDFEMPLETEVLKGDVVTCVTKRPPEPQEAGGRHRVTERVGVGRGGEQDLQRTGGSTA